MTHDEWFDLEEKYDSVTKPWKWGHSETIKTDDGKTITAFFHAYEGIQEIIINE